MIRPTVDLIQHNLSAIGTGDAIDQMRIGIALEEALYNALYHGNLEITSEELAAARSSGAATAVSDLLRQRQSNAGIAESPHCRGRSDHVAHGAVRDSR